MGSARREYWQEANCDEDCFNCKYPDCVWNGVISSDDARERDDYARRILMDEMLQYTSDRYDRKRARSAARYRAGAKTRRAWRKVQLQLSRDIKAARNKRGWTQRETAELHAISVTKYARWEQGVEEIPEDVITAIYPELKGANAWAKRYTAARAAGLVASRPICAIDTEN